MNNVKISKDELEVILGVKLIECQAFLVKHSFCLQLFNLGSKTELWSYCETVLHKGLKPDTGRGFYVGGVVIKTRQSERNTLTRFVLDSGKSSVYYVPERKLKKAEIRSAVRRIEDRVLLMSL